MPDEITLRRFEACDAEAVSQLIIANLLHVNVRDYGEAVMTQLARCYVPASLPGYAQAGEMVVAVAGLTLVGTATLEGDLVRNVFVRIDHHGQGIGRRLMRHIEDLARRQGLPRLWLRANIAAVDFYRKLGYTPVGLKEERVGEALLKTMVMEKTP